MAIAQPRFVQVQDAELAAIFGPSFGVAWGDIDADGRADLWITNHAAPPSFLRNAPGGFVDASGLLEAPAIGDMHGLGWVDADRNGHEDLLIQAGADFGEGEGPNLYLINDGRRLRDVALARGVAYAEGRGRSPLWLDWNGDGLLDVLLSNWRRPDGESPTAILTQRGDGTFVDDTAAVGLQTTGDNNHAVLWHDAANDAVRLIVQTGASVDRSYDFSAAPWIDVTSRLDAIRGPLTKELVVADFDGSGTQDIYLARLAVTSEAVQVDSNQIIGRLTANNRTESLRAAAAQPVTLDGVPPEAVRLGAQGLVPDALPVELDPLDPANQGVIPADPPPEDLFVIGYDTNAGEWIIEGRGKGSFDFSFLLTTETAFTGLQTEFVDQPERDHRVYLQGANGDFINATNASGLGEARACRSVAAADFDNDMDLDLFQICSGTAINRSNRYLENDGHGVFTERFDHGAEGTLIGRADVGIVADYDGDGYLDILTTNGNGPRPFNEGPVELFRNVGGSNGWLRLELRGAVSNPHGIGALITVTAGGVSQTRLVDGGARNSGQDEKVVHFGLGTAAIVDAVTIRWPSGIVQQLGALAPGQRLVVREAVSAGAGDGLLRVTGEATAAGVVSLQLSNTSFDIDVSAGATAQSVQEQIVTAVNALAPGTARLADGVVVIEGQTVVAFAVRVAGMDGIVLQSGVDPVQTPGLQAWLVLFFAILLWFGLSVRPGRVAA